MQPINTETRSRELLREMISAMYTPKTPYHDGTRVFVCGMWGTIAGCRFAGGNGIDPVYVVMFDNGGKNTHVMHHMIDVS